MYTCEEFVINTHCLPTGDSFIVGTYSSKNEAHLLVYGIKESTGTLQFTQHYFVIDQCI